MEKVKWIKDEKGIVVTEDEKIRERWKQYYCTLMNEGAMGADEQRKGRVAVGGVEEVIVGEVERALRKMKSGRAVGPDDIPMEVWKLVGSKASIWLQDLFNRMLVGDSMPEEWIVSGLVPLYNGGCAGMQ